MQDNQKGYYQKLEDSFIRACSEVLFALKDDQEYLKKNIHAYTAQVVYDILKKSLASIIKEITDNKRGLLQYLIHEELNRYYNYKPAIQKDRLKKAIIFLVTSYANRTDLQNKFEQSNPGKTYLSYLQQFYSEAIETQVIEIGLELYSDQFEKLNNFIRTLTGQTSEDVKFVETPLSKIFIHKNKYLLFIEQLHTLKWINARYEWDANSEIYITPLISFMVKDMTILNTVKQVPISKAFKGTFSINLKEVTLRSITKIAANTARLKIIDSNFDFLSHKPAA